MKKKIVVLGMGVSGKATAAYLKSKGEEILCVDRNSGEDIHPEEKMIDFENVLFLVPSPGIPPKHPWIVAAKAKKVPVIGEFAIAAAELLASKTKLLAITGANGKTTTTALTAHILNQSGIKAEALGNIGTPVLSYLLQKERADVLVIEASSFQLDLLPPIPLFHAGLITNITPNHLDRYASFEEYLDAKMHLQECIVKDGTLFISQKFKEFLSPTTNYSFFENFQEKVASISKLSYTKGSDFENCVSAFLLCNLCGVNETQFSSGFATFQKPPHRLEFVRRIGDVAYVNDSKATSVEAVINAVNTINGEIILIAGGTHKGSGYEPWLPVFAGKVAKLFLIGEAAELIQETLSPKFSCEVVHTLENAVEKASRNALPNQTVLLSPGCSSYDQFKDYQHRGDSFKQLIGNIP